MVLNGRGIRESFIGFWDLAEGFIAVRRILENFCIFVVDLVLLGNVFLFKKIAKTNITCKK